MNREDTPHPAISKPEQPSRPQLDFWRKSESELCSSCVRLDIWTRLKELPGEPRGQHVAIPRKECVSWPQEVPYTAEDFEEFKKILDPINRSTAVSLDRDGKVGRGKRPYIVRPPNLGELLPREDEIYWDFDVDKPLEGISNILEAAESTDANRLLLRWRTSILAVLDKEASEFTMRRLTQAELNVVNLLRRKYPRSGLPTELIGVLGRSGRHHRWKDYLDYWRHVDEKRTGPLPRR